MEGVLLCLLAARHHGLPGPSQVQTIDVVYGGSKGFFSIKKIEKSIDGVLGIRTHDRKMVGADETTELWRLPKGLFFLSDS